MKKVGGELNFQVKPTAHSFVFTDKWPAYRGILPKSKHIVGKRYTKCLESINAKFRHYLCRFRHKTKEYTKSKSMVLITLMLFAFKCSILNQQSKN
ncbi:IS1 family transposase [Candidatus Cardinium hertigii]|uniref:IS1 family transposase n=1 Tax=Candidatus Cardinium hertigii TaxID=247481 RepID=UPI003D7D0880